MSMSINDCTYCNGTGEAPPRIFETEGRPCFRCRETGVETLWGVLLLLPEGPTWTKGTGDAPYEGTWDEAYKIATAGDRRFDYGETILVRPIRWGGMPIALTDEKERRA